MRDKVLISDQKKKRENGTFIHSRLNFLTLEGDQVKEAELFVLTTSLA